MPALTVEPDYALAHIIAAPSSSIITTGMKGSEMTKRPKTSVSASKHSKKDVKANRDGSRTGTDSTAGSSRRVTPTSERIIRETSVKRRKAMTVLANR